MTWCDSIAYVNFSARFPKELPSFFIKFLTDPKKDIVLDFFAGSNATGEAAEESGRKWLAFEIERKYLAASAFRFVDTKDENEIKAIYNKLMDENTCNVRIG